MLTALMTLTLLVDVAFTFAPTFNFGPTEVVAAVEQIRHFSGRALVVAVGVIACVMLVAIVLVLLRGKRVSPPERRMLATLCGTFALVAVGADILNGSSAIGWRPRTVVPIDVATSLFASQFRKDLSVPPPIDQPREAASDALRASIAGAAGGAWEGPNKIVLVVVESMGYPRGAKPSALFAPLMRETLSRRFAIRTGIVPFWGATTGAELRELCGVAMNHFTALQAASLQSCLPAQLRSLGYESLALHGYNGSLFRRRDWYPRVGFDRIAFREELQAEHRHVECGMVFHGVCDSSFTKIIRNELTRAPVRRQFVYWLTLSSHFPLDPRTGSSGMPCATLGAVGREEGVCSLWRALWPVIEGMARLAEDPAVPPAWYIIVGDHPPPQLFSDTNLFLQYRVPFIELRPIVRGYQHQP